jgi:hypothetical protein
MAGRDVGNTKSEISTRRMSQVASSASLSLDSVTSRLTEKKQARGGGSPAAGSRMGGGAWESPDGHAEAMPSRDASHATQRRSRKNTYPWKSPREDTRYIICGLTS